MEQLFLSENYTERRIHRLKGIMRMTSRHITSGTKEWADYNVNCVKGCSNDCRYCYAKMMGKRFGRFTEENWKDMEINEAAVKKNYPKLIYISFSRSPFAKIYFVLINLNAKS